MFPNGKKYIGITGAGYKKRWGKGGIGYKGQLVYNAIEKYGWYNTKHYILLKDLTREEAEQKEIELIAKHNTTDRKYGYNIAKGGSTTAKRYRKVVCINTGEVFDSLTDATNKYNARVDQACKGNCKTAGVHPITKEKLIWQYYDEWLIKPKQYKKTVKKKDIEKNKKRYICIETKEVYNSEEEAANSVNINVSGISSVCKGKQKTAGGYHWAYYDEYIKDPDKYDELAKQNNYNNGKPKKVLCIETNVIYNNCSEAANSINVNRASISRVCRGERKTAGGLHWKYVD